MNITEDQFDQREQTIKVEMKYMFPKMRQKDFHIIDMFCTIYKDKFCDNN